VFGILGASDSLDRVYFVAGGVLDDGAIAEQPNLYLWDSGTTTFLTVLDPTPGLNELAAGGDDVRSDRMMWSVWTDVTRDALVRVSPDGHLLFTSRARVTGYDNASPECHEGRCQQVYLYDPDANELNCVSCLPSGLPPTGSAHLGGQRNTALVESDDSDLRPRELASDGTRAFFETGDALVSGDSNGLYDVYEWRGGAVRLVSSGAGSYDSRFLDASPDGRDVFLLTRNPFTPSDKDQNIDLYDSREGGGFPEPVPPPECEGDACLSPPNPPNDLTPGSATFHGKGDPAGRSPKPKCRKGKVRRKGRCVKRRHKQSTRSRSKSRGAAK
jgi:hypothetical protein